MTRDFSIRRVVTGHDLDGNAIVTEDRLVAGIEPRPGQQACILWAEPVPANNAVQGDGATRASGARLPGGATFRAVCYGPRTSGNMHRTQTTDFGVVISGALILELEHGIEVTISAGETIVQRGTIHRWINRSDEPCIVAFVLIDALPPA